MQLFSHGFWNLDVWFVSMVRSYVIFLLPHRFCLFLKPVFTSSFLNNDWMNHWKSISHCLHCNNSFACTFVATQRICVRLHNPNPVIPATITPLSRTQIRVWRHRNPSLRFHWNVHELFVLCVLYQRGKTQSFCLPHFRVRPTANY